MSAKKRALGRGLESLIGSSPSRSAAVASPEAPEGRQVVELLLDQIQPNINQPRKEFHPEALQELADSIREKGIMQPLLVRKAGAHFELIAGERRFRAARSIPLDSVPCIIENLSDEESFEWALIENLQREDLNAIEESRAFRSLMEQFDLGQEEVARRVGKSRSTVANSLRLLNLPLDIQEDILEERLTAGHARAILSLDDPQKQRSLRNLIVGKALSVREAETRAKAMRNKKQPKPPEPSTVEVQRRNLQEEMSMKIGLPVKIKAVSSKAGKVELEYQSLDDFEQILNFFGVEPT